MIFAMVAVLELVLCLLDHGDQFRHLHASHLRFDSLLFGVMLAYLFHFRGTWLVPICRRWWPMMLVLAAALVTPAFVVKLNLFLSTWWLMPLYLASGMLLLTAVCNGWAFGRIGQPSRGSGATPYSIYIWHMFVIEHGVNRIRFIYENHYHQPTPWLGYAVISVLLCAGFGIVMAKAVEYPVLYLRDRWFPSRSAAS